MHVMMVVAMPRFTDVPLNSFGLLQARVGGDDNFVGTLLLPSLFLARACVEAQVRVLDKAAVERLPLRDRGRIFLDF